MPFVAAPLLDDVDHATHRAAIFGLVAARLDLDFLDEFENDVLPDTAVLNFRSVESFDEVGVLGISRAINLKTVIPAGVLAWALQVFLTRARSKRNQRLIRTSLGNVVDDLLRDVYSDL